MSREIWISNKSLVAIKLSLVAFSVVALAISLSLLVPVFANSHSSTITVTPDNVKANTQYLFTAHVENDPGSADPIHEFRIYHHGEFTNYNCQVVTGWNGPYLIHGALGWYCQYVAKTTGDYIDPGESKDFTFYATTPKTECCRPFYFETRDPEQYYRPLTDEVCIDSTSPETTKTYDGPYKIDPECLEACEKTYEGFPELIEKCVHSCPQWISSKTLVKLEAKDDVGPHDSGIAETWYKDIWLENPEDWRYCYGYCYEWEPNPLDDPEWQLYTGEPFYKKPESCHIIEYYSVDGVGNVEPVKWQCVFVDNTPPIGKKEVGDPKIPIPDDFEESSDGEAGWSDEESYNGMYSAKLVMPDEASSDDFTGVDSFFDVFVKLDDITSLSYYRKVTSYDKGWSPLVVLGIDTNGDGNYEAQPLEWEASLAAGSVDPDLLGDDSFIQCEATTGLVGTDTTFVKVDAYNNFKCYTPNVAGDGYEAVYDYLSHFQNNDVGRVETTDKVAMIKVMLNYPAADNEIVYVDYVEMNGNIIIDESAFLWVTQNTPITLSCEDQEPHPVDQEKVFWRISLDGEWCDWQSASAPKTIKFTEDSFHDLEFYCEDHLGNKEETHPVQYYKVDTEPPKITKTMIGTDHLGECPPGPSPQEPCYVKDDGKNGVHVDVTDGGKICAVDLVECDYEVWLKGEKIDSGSFGEEGKDIIFTKDSTHTLKIKCKDKLGNEMKEDIEDFLVDSTPPVTTKTYIPDAYIDPETDAEYIDTTHKVKLEAEDNKVGVDRIEYRVSGALADKFCENCEDWMTSLRPDMGPWNIYKDPFAIPEESCHVIEYRSVDKLGNEEEIKWQCVFVDKTPPKVSALQPSPEGSFRECEPGEECDYWVRDHVTEIKLSCYDLQPHPSGVKLIEYRWKVDGKWPESNPNGEWLTYTDPIVFEEDSVHELEYRCTDNVGKMREGPGKVYRVDSTPPETTKIVSEPKKIDKNGVEWIDTETKITLDSIDPDPTGKGCNVGVKETNYLNIIDQSEEPCWHPEVCEKLTPPDAEWETYTGDPIQKDEESCHILFYYSVDELGNDEKIQVNCFFVDKTPPELIKTVGDPKLPLCNLPERGPEYYIETYVLDGNPDSPTVYVKKTLDCEKVIWDIEIEDQGNPFCDYGHTEFGLPIGFSEDKAEFQVGTGQMFGAGSPPIYQECDGPSMDPPYGCWAGGSGPTHDLPEGIVVTNPGGSGEPGYGDRVFHVEIPMEYLNNGEFYWAISVYGGQNYGYCKSGYQEYPDTWVKWSGAGIYAYDGWKDWWVKDHVTPITLDCIDPEPHPSGHEELCYRISFDDPQQPWLTEDYCKEFGGTIEGEWCCVDTLPYVFNFPEESLHDLRWFCRDAVDKTSDIDIEYFRVDSTPPEPKKTVGKPRTEWYPTLDLEDPDYVKFYPEIVDKCWSKDPEKFMECWKVTLSTPITLDCIDPDPTGRGCAVDHEETCFKVEVDGDDVTEEYCGYVGGNYDKYEDGFCCGLNAPYEFHFNEETEHNLKYYCVDALENKGLKIDEEKFKVEGEPFEIEINKKWNLISVPFMLINDDIKEVLKDVEDSIESVWTYDPEDLICDQDWCVYTPDEDDTNDNLHNMIPGWGYWVLALKDDLLVIGGSEMRPVVPPPSRGLEEGWNLIGYHGTEGLPGYYGPAENGDHSYCALYTLRNEESIYPPTKWSSLITYWEPDNPDQWYEYGVCDQMDPGAGYWIFMDDEKIYARATACPEELVNLICGI